MVGADWRSLCPQSVSMLPKPPAPGRDWRIFTSVGRIVWSGSMVSYGGTVWRPCRRGGAPPDPEVGGLRVETIQS